MDYPGLEPGQSLGGATVDQAAVPGIPGVGESANLDQKTEQARSPTWRTAYHLGSNTNIDVIVPTTKQDGDVDDVVYDHDDGVYDDVDGVYDEVDGVYDDVDGVYDEVDGVYDDVDGVYDEWMVCDDVDGVYDDVDGVYDEVDGVYDEVDGVYDEVDGVYDDVDGVYDDVDGVYDDVDGVYDDVDDEVDDDVDDSYPGIQNSFFGLQEPFARWCKLPLRGSLARGEFGWPYNRLNSPVAAVFLLQFLRMSVGAAVPENVGRCASADGCAEGEADRDVVRQSGQLRHQGAGTFSRTMPVSNLCSWIRGVQKCKEESLTHQVPRCPSGRYIIQYDPNPNPCRCTEL
ncbi:hypothetical protein Bbelb_203110 [Branchiostoma belcheri]|nr:hypothetical protein Bbelb_203110 [Branchiostoma belcheri]